MARHSLSEIEALCERGENPTRSYILEAASLGKDSWKSARVVMPRGKTSVHLRLDNDVTVWFRAGGKGHLARTNAVLRAYVEAQKRGA
jgi:uncharacterized protein (DUF4415 family)